MQHGIEQADVAPDDFNHNVCLIDESMFSGGFKI